MTSKLNTVQRLSDGELYFMPITQGFNNNISLSDMIFMSKIDYMFVHSGFGFNIETELGKINKRNAFYFFQQYKNKNTGVFDMMSRYLIGAEMSDNLNIRQFVMPITYLLKQAEVLGLENSDAYKGLKQRNRELCALLLKVENAPKLSDIVLNDFDTAINDLLIIMNKIIH